MKRWTFASMVAFICREIWFCILSLLLKFSLNLATKQPLYVLLQICYFYKLYLLRVF
ncbi:hypothetical protein KFK09_009918 [Dendrobium nobile]|uniref:Uncharacterized protein n=1 Tax=Dendrobium nobile TaxID=94219 RepID=A0A8T3BNY7_DENNO|nr:hypothetical protein KFK09_009918 [Dendrobium nobile]